ncbi:MAG: hypothetical protein MJ101_03505 [Clostridia bacterium]|nr:hypothetical protein [Clostridia bacterium]
MADDFSDKLAQVLNDPQAMAKISAIASAMSQGQQQTARPAQTDKSPAGQIKPQPNNIANCLALISALMPYLNQSRRRRAARLCSMLKTAQAAEIMLKSGGR